LSEQIAGLASARPAAEGAEPGLVAGGDVEAAVRQAERRINAHVDDAVLALAQTLLGKGNDLEGVVAPVDVAVTVAEPVVEQPEQFAEADDDDDEYDEDEDEAGYVPALDDVEDVAPIDFSSAEHTDEAATPVLAWTPAESAQPDQPSGDAYSYSPAAPYAAATPSEETPFDQDGPWHTPRQDGGGYGSQDDPTVVPERRRRWFSW
jgi:hypothetical protein